MTTAVLTPADILNQAADLIQVEGHSKGDYLNSDGCYCAVGALCQASTGTPSEITEVTVAAGNVLALHINPERELRTSMSFHSAIVAWNDARDRTAEEVITTMRAAAKAVTA